jgi:hypothetical protein
MSTSHTDYVIFDPTVAPEAEAFARAPRRGDLSGLRVMLLDNGKPNSAALLRLVGERLAATAGVSVARLVRKPSAYKPAADAELDEAAAGADLVLAGIGD